MRRTAGNHRSTFWPHPAQELLLKASLGSGDVAAVAFEQWSAGRDLNELDGGSVRLLPLLYQNLLDHRVPVPSAMESRLRGVYRHSWFKHQLVMKTAADVLERFAQAGVPTLVLKGIPLALAYYPKPATRPMNDIDVLVPVARARDALDVALSLGMEPLFPAGDWPPRLTASKALRHADGWEVDLHTHVMHQYSGVDADATCWERARPLAVGRASTLTLETADHVLHVIAHGVWRTSLSPVRWVADVAMLISRGGATMSWSRLVEQARRRRLSYVVGRALRYTASLLALDIPADVLALDAAGATLAERYEYRARFLPGVAGIAACRLADFARIRDREPDWRGPLGFVRYLRDCWRLPSAWLLPASAVNRTARHVTLAVQRSFSRPSLK